MTDGADILAAILANPDDDTVRLVYADWLQENGQGERAEFIRLQIELARYVEPVAGNGVRHFRGDTAPDVLRRVAELDRRERELLEEWDIENGRWLDWLPCGPFVLQSHPNATLNGRCELRRGFVEHVTCSAADWLAHCDAICASHPVRKVKLTTRHHWVARGYDGAPFVLHEDPHRVEVSDEAVGAELRKARGTDKAIDILTAILTVRWPGIEFELPDGGLPVPHAFTPAALFPAAPA